MAKYATVLALFALFAVALAATVPKEAPEAAPKDLNTASGIGFGFYGLPFYGGLYRGFYGYPFYGGFYG